MLSTSSTLFPRPVKVQPRQLVGGGVGPGVEMDNVLVEYDIDTLEPATKEVLVNRSLKPSAETIQLLSQENAPINDTTPGDLMVINIPNHYPNKPADVYVKVVESTVGKRGSKSAVAKDYHRCVFKGIGQTNENIISKSLCIPENGYCVWKDGDTIKSTQYKPQLYILIVRYDAPTEAFLSSVFSINTTYRCASTNHSQKKQKIEEGSPLGIDYATSMVPLPLTRPVEKLGTTHMHVDGGNDITAIVAGHLRQAYPQCKFKTTPVALSVAGSQRDLEQYKQTYISHTPGEQETDFQQFVTIPLMEGEAGIEVLKSVMSAILPYKGFVVEVEQIVGRIDRFGTLEWLNRAEAHVIESATIGFKRSFTLPYEIHFVLDLPKVESSPFIPISLQQLMNGCSALGMHMGGWFVCSKDEYPPRWCYRSNNFEKDLSHKENIKNHWQLINSMVKNMGIQEYTLTCTIERILGVWNTSTSQLLRVTQAAPIKDAEELACWEAEFDDLQEFWVVTPNFLGDKLEVVLEAMVNNLRRNVRYRYFLNSFADACRWQQLVRTLKNTLKYTTEKMSRLMQAVIIWQDVGPTIHLNGETEYFVAIPNTGIKSAEGYCLKRLRDGEVYEGERLSLAELEEVLNSLKVFTDKRPGILGYMHVPLQAQDIHGAYVVRVRFGEAVLDESSIRHREYLIGEQVSKHSGEFVSAIGGDFICLFQRPSVALGCAANLQTISGVQKIAIDVGPIARELRASGFDITGRAVQNCAQLLDQAGQGTLLMTQTFLDFMNTLQP